MAAIGNDPNGRRRVLFFGADGRRHTIRLGEVSKRDAEAFRARIEAITNDQILGRPHDVEMAKWIENLDPRMRKRLAKAGLVATRGRADMALGKFLDEHFRAMTVKGSTLTIYGHTRRCLESFFGKDRVVRTITAHDGDKFRQFLRDEGRRVGVRRKAPGKGAAAAKLVPLSEATVSKRVVVARQAFKRAVKWKLADENPFSEVVAGPQTNKSRMFFVSAAAAARVLDACPDLQWKIIFALSRWGGLRCPSEHLAIKWTDIDWNGRIVVHSPKTAHHDGGESRVIPIFPELLPLLKAAWAEAEEGGSPYVITRFRDPRTNLRTEFTRIIKRAGLVPWPRLFHQLRASRQTELAECYPMHVVCAWIGNSPAVAQAHYLQLHDAHFAQAIETPAGKSGTVLAQHPQVPEGTGGKENPPQMQKPADIPAGSRVFPSVQKTSGPDWIRTTGANAGNQEDFRRSGTENGTPPAAATETLRAEQQRQWEALPDDVRAALLAQHARQAGRGPR